MWHARGLRQGNVLSQMLFILVMDALCLLSTQAEEEGFMSHINEAPSILQRLFMRIMLPHFLEQLRMMPT
jgi:hypothetical protein